MTARFYSVPPGITSIMLGDGTVLTPVGGVVVADSKWNSEMSRCGCTSFFPESSRVLWQCGVPFVMPAGDGGSTGLTFTGTRGVFTLSAAILANAYNMLSGCYLYLPAGAGGLASAGWRWAQFAGDTAGEVFANTYTPGTGLPPFLASPTPLGDLTSGRITQTTSEITCASCAWPGGLLGNNGELRFAWKQVADSSANGKQFAFKCGSTFLAYMSVTTSSLDTDKEAIVQNAGVPTKQIATRKNDGIGASSTSYSSDASSLDTTADQAISMTMKLAANTDGMIFVPRKITAEYGA